MEISEKTIRFIQDHAKDDVNALRLKFLGKSQKPDIPIDFAILQIEARRKAMKKLPSFLENPFFIFPDALAAEQASNEAVARFHASLISKDASLLDMTAGLGIDDLTFAAKGVNVTACESDRNKAEALQHNAEIFGVESSLQAINIDSTDYIKKCGAHYDVVFADPGRRSISGKRLHALSDCQPDILAALPDIFNSAPRLIVKSSPLLDLTLIHDTVEGIFHIYIVCFKGECKEVLLDIRRDETFTGITVVDLDMEKEISRFKTDFPIKRISSTETYCDRKEASDYSYIYEPNAGIMKTGAWATLIETYPDLMKADPNTHIFLSDTYYPDFPGRVMKVISQPDKKALKGLKGKQINVISRNHPMTAPMIATKYRIISGGNAFLFAFRYRGTPCLILSSPTYNTP